MFWFRAWRSEDVRVFRCDSCSVLFLFPSMEEEESVDYYRHYSTHLHERGVAQNESPAQTFGRRSRTGKYRVEVVEKFLVDGDSILEVGGGCGNFLVDVTQRRMGLRAVLVESCREHLHYARQILGLQGCEDLKDVKGTFNKIFLFHVLEHIAQPTRFLEACRRLLTDHGMIVVEVPCSEDPLISLFDCSAYKDFCFQPMHPFVHCRSSLDVLFEKSGFETVQFIPFQRYPLSNHLQWLSKGLPGGNDELTEMLGSKCENAYKKRLEALGLTDTLFGVFRKR